MKIFSSETPRSGNEIPEDGNGMRIEQPRSILHSGPSEDPLYPLFEPSNSGQGRVGEPEFRDPFGRRLLPRAEAVRQRWLLAAILLALTFFTSTTLGAGWYLSTRTDITTDLLPWLGAETIFRVWNDPGLLAIGLTFSVPTLFILLCHELGHYLACRRYRLPSTLPYFIPAPVGLGTFGAFIKIKAAIRSKKELFDVGVAGPLAGFVALLPFLFYGIALSTPAALDLADPRDPFPLLLFVPGKSLAVAAVSWLFHGPLPADTILDLHPFALAAWVGLLATSLNLLPLGQLDGGHIFYAAAGPLQRKLALPLWLLLAVASVFWRGWLFWCFLSLIMGLRHPPVWDETVPLDSKRRWLALASLILLVISFAPVPLSLVSVGS